jgi:hypothetical protein
MATSIDVFEAELQRDIPEPIMTPAMSFSDEKAPATRAEQ